MKPSVLYDDGLKERLKDPEYAFRLVETIVKEYEAERETWGNEFSAVIIMKEQVAGLESMLMRINEHVFPGSSDSIDGLKRLVRERDQYYTEAKQQAARVAELEDTVLEAGQEAMKIQAQFEQQTERTVDLQRMNDGWTEELLAVKHELRASTECVTRLSKALWEAQRCIGFVQMSSGIADDGNHKDPMQAHRDNWMKTWEFYEWFEKFMPDWRRLPAMFSEATRQETNECGGVEGHAGKPSDTSGIKVGTETPAAGTQALPASTTVQYTTVIGALHPENVTVTTVQATQVLCDVCKTKHPTGEHVSHATAQVCKPNHDWGRWGLKKEWCLQCGKTREEAAQALDEKLANATMPELEAVFFPEGKKPTEPDDAK